ncbi:polysaccharide pyruvyl transferase family protein [Rhodococcus sp. NPDC055024]
MRRFFMSIAAAQGNLGDIEIRRTAVDYMRDLGLSPVVFSGRMSAEYVDAFDWEPTDEVMNSGFRFWRAVLADTVRRKRAVIVMAPGPAVLGASVASVVKHSLLVAVFAVLRIFGARILVLGRSIEVRSSFAAVPEKILVGIADVYAARDKRTCEYLRGKSRFYPDLAFRGSTSDVAKSAGQGSAAREIALLSLRHDRPVNYATLRSIHDQVSAKGLDLMACCQVVEDDNHNREVAATLGIPYVGWDDDVTHRQQEFALRTLYERAAVTISDRLHVLILSARGGSIPVMSGSSSVPKLRDSLEPVLAPQASWMDDSAGGSLNLGHDESARIFHGMDSAAAELEDLRSRIKGAVMP